MVRRVAVLVAVVVLALPGAAQAGGPLVTAVMDRNAFAGEDAGLVFERVRAAGASVARIDVSWRSIAPARRPDGFDARDPNDSAYRWEALDTKVELAAAAGIEPLLQIDDAPRWAQEPGDLRKWGNWRVDAEEFGRFGRAIAERYDGLSGFPRVRYWEVWNEPNLSLYFNPQFAFAVGLSHDPDKVLSADLYRRLVNEFAAAVHGVRADNLVVAGGLAPFGSFHNFATAVAPLRFMRRLLCLPDGPTSEPTCTDKIRFDVWSAHPYTSGGPTHQARQPDDVSIGDLPEMRRLLTAGVKSGSIVTKRPVRFWVTEFSWDSSPPDRYGVPARLHARWVAEALYRMWQSGVSLVTWFRLRDAAVFGPDSATEQSGLYLRGASVRSDRPKLALKAFRFPFVAFRNGRRIDVWGRTPSGKAGRIVVEQATPGGWKRLAMLRADGYGIFQASLPERTRGQPVRARLLGGTTASLAFSLVRPPDLRVNPFGGPVTSDTP